jgi:hypothetical protein
LIAFGFMALLGLLSLSGMLLKNGIVLLVQVQVNTELGEGTEPHKAVFMSGVSRVRPVSMAAAHSFQDDLFSRGKKNDTVRIRVPGMSKSKLWVIVLQASSARIILSFTHERQNQGDD